jgi:hypothetical protein
MVVAPMMLVRLVLIGLIGLLAACGSAAPVGDQPQVVADIQPTPSPEAAPSSATATESDEPKLTLILFDEPE